MKIAYLLLSFLLVSCSHSEPDRSAEEAAAIAVLPAAAVEESLANAEKELSRIDDKIRSAESRRDNARNDPKKENIVDGAEAEIADLESQRLKVEHRRHLLEGRRRELNKDKTDKADY